MLYTRYPLGRMRCHAPNDASFQKLLLPTPRAPQHASRARVIRAIAVRMAPHRSRAGRGCELVVHKGSAKHLATVQEPHHIPSEHFRRILLILVCVIAIEEGVSEALLFGMPSCMFQRRPRLRVLPPAPFNTRCDGCGRIAHRSPPLPDRTNTDHAARRTHRLRISGHRTDIAQRMPGGSTHRVLCKCLICSTQLYEADGSFRRDD